MSSKKIGIIGAGRLGTALARALSTAGYDTSISNSRGKDSLALQLQVLLPEVTARDVEDLVMWAEVIILAIPLPRFTLLPLEMIKGKIVVDAMNYWAPVDGRIAEFDAYAGSSSELVAQSIPGANVVKSLNSVAYGEIEECLVQKKAVRRAMPMAGDSAPARQVVATLIDAIGFEPVDLGGLDQGIRFQPDTKLFNQRLTRSEVLRTT